MLETNGLINSIFYHIFSHQPRADKENTAVIARVSASEISFWNSMIVFEGKSVKSMWQLGFMKILLAGWNQTHFANGLKNGKNQLVSLN